MTEEVKDIATTMQGSDRREAVEAMKNLLDKLRQLPDWPGGQITFQLDDGRVVEVRSQSGTAEAFEVYIQTKT